MTISYTQAAWLGIREHTDDPALLLTVANLRELRNGFSGPRPLYLATTVTPGVMAEAARAHGRWSAHRRLAGS